MFLSKIRSQKLVTLIIESSGLTAFVWHNTAVTHNFTYIFEAHEIYELTIFNSTALVKLLKTWFKEAQLSPTTPVLILVDSPGVDEHFFPKEASKSQEVQEKLKSACSSYALENGFYCAKLAAYKRTQYHLWALQTPFTLVGIQTVTLVYYYAAQNSNYINNGMPQNFFEWRVALQESCFEKSRSQLYWYEVGVRCLIERFLQILF